VSAAGQRPGWCVKHARAKFSDEWGWHCDRCDDEALAREDVELLISHRDDEAFARANRAREWEWFHPGEPMPSSERNQS
jgi:hypothetical protein